MLIDKYKKFFLTIEDIYFSDEIIQNKSDISRYFQYYGQQNIECKKKFTTSIIPLNVSNQEIFKKFSKSTRSGINQAIKNHKIITNSYFSVDESVVDDFCEYYNKMVIMKKISFANREKIIRLKDHVLITNAVFQDKILVWHLYICDDNRVRLLYSCSEQSSNRDDFSKIISKANKLLHYEDIKFVNYKKYKVFDFGGVSLINSEVLGIDQFKLSFSKTMDDSCNLIIANSFLGRLSLLLYRLIGRNL